MSAAWLSQVALPWVLASVMMAMGLSLTGADFARTWRHPRRVLLGTGLQMLALPLLAWTLVLLLPLPPLEAAGLLLLVTLLPVLAGMLLRQALPARWLEVVLPEVKGFTGVAMISVVVALFASHAERLPSLLSLETLAVLLLCLFSMLLGHGVARRLHLPHDSVRAITVEVGVQNAGVAMMVAFVLLQQPAIGLVPLLYGLLMNVPVVLWMFACLWRDRHRASAVAERR